MIPFILGALAAVGISELSKRGKPKMAKGGSVSHNDECILDVIKMVSSEFKVEDYYITLPPVTEKDKRLVIILKDELKVNDIDSLNKKLKTIKGCSTVFNDEFEIGYGENYKSLVLQLKKDNFSVAKFSKGGGVKGYSSPKE